ncbi:hypothetical protein MKK70_22465 [Methylobacterium sp. E-041]|uniref:hypothetical protein n=1 Tax=Methylobacterium sp. E-041 TaxID=2836573 RepID=UPI001FBBFCD7|nr:hypothetical protein [Methylobacterium sp. E-041]MCJ2108086.1 hypothetical protein [Methylobacterium sp. E-041]
MTALVHAGLWAALSLAAAAIAPARELAPAKTAMARYLGTWAPSKQACGELHRTANERLTIQTADDGLYLFDARAGDISCRIDKQRHYPDGVNLDTICQHGQQPPYNFRTDYSFRLTPARTLMVTNSFVDQKPEVVEFVRCAKQDLPDPSDLAQVEAASASQYVLPPLKDGEFYAGQAYPADYAERRMELLGAKAKPLARVAGETCTHAFCRRYPEIRACYADYCVGRWERVDGATVDYVVKPDDLTVLKTVCRDTCGADEIRPPAR